MDSLEEKYLKLLDEHEKLINSSNSKKVNIEQKYQEHIKYLQDNRTNLTETIKKLYSSWLPPKIKSFIDTIKSWAKTGFKKSNFAERRLAICRDCPSLTKNDICTLCGCYMKNKTKLAGAKCPIGIWGDEKEES